MTNEEAITRLESLLDAAAECAFTKTAEAIQTAIEALKKQIPMKPKYLLRDSENDACDCPICERPLWTDYKHMHCPYCGQAIDWSDVK